MAGTRTVFPPLFVFGNGGEENGEELMGLQWCRPGYALSVYITKEAEAMESVTVATRRISQMMK